MIHFLVETFSDITALAQYFLFAFSFCFILFRILQSTSALQMEMYDYPLKNKGASRCHKITFLSKWFHKEPLTSEEPFCFTQCFFVVKEGSSDYKKVRKRWFFEEPLTELFLVEPKIVLLWHRLKKLFKHLYF